MSGVVSGISKAFTAVGSAVARVGSAVASVGATTVTAGAASAAGGIATGGLAGVVQSVTGTGVLGNILTGAITQAGYGALMGGAIGALTGTGFGKGALMGAAGGAVSGGLFGAAGLNPDPLTAGFGQSPQAAANGLAPSPVTATGFAPTGATAAPITSPMSAAPNLVSSVPTTSTMVAPVAAPAAAPVAAPGGFGQFLSNNGGEILSGLGKGLGGYMEAKSKEEEGQKDRDAVAAKDQSIRDSYNVGSSALHGAATPVVGMPTPAQKYSRMRYEYSQSEGRMISVPA